MLSPEYSAILNKVWAGFSPANELKPLAVLDLINSLLFIKQLDETQAEKGKISVLSGNPIENPIYIPEQQDLRWSSFQYLDQDTQFELFYGKDGVLEFAKSRPEYRAVRRFDKGDKPLIPPRFLLSETISLINQLNVPDDGVRHEMIDYLLKKAEARKETPSREIPPRLDDHLVLKADVPKKTTLSEVQREEDVFVPRIETPKRTPRQEVPQERDDFEPVAVEPQRKASPKTGLSKSFYKTLLFVFIVAFVVTLLYFNLKKPGDRTSNISSPAVSKNTRENDSPKALTPVSEPVQNDTLSVQKVPDKIVLPPTDAAITKKTDETVAARTQPKNTNTKPTVIDGDTVHDAGNNEKRENSTTGEIKGRYKIAGKAYFHDEPDESTRRNAFVVHWNNSYATLEALDETTNFIYVVFRNHQKQVSKGWLRKKDLIPVE